MSPIRLILAASDLAARAPVVPDPDQARDWLREELSKPEYQPTLAERVADAIQDLLSRLDGSRVPVIGSWWWLLLLVLLAGAVVAVLTRIRRRRPAPTDAGGVFDGDELRDASEHRTLAQTAMARGDWSTAVVEAMRALTAGLIERELLPALPGITSREVTQRAAQRFAALAPELDRAALIFDETRYGDRPADRPRAEALLALESQVRATQPDRSAAGAPISAVPR